jgi:hypothetical protein
VEGFLPPGAAMSDAARAAAPGDAHPAMWRSDQP